MTAARREPRAIVAYAPCPICGARCAHRLNSVGRIYGYCHGDDDAANKACGSDWRFGRTHSVNFIAKAKTAAPPASSPAPAPGGDKVSDGRDGKPAGPDGAGGNKWSVLG